MTAECAEHPGITWGALQDEALRELRRCRAAAPEWQAEMLCAGVRGCSRIANRLARDARPDAAQRQRFEDLLTRAVRHEPLAYLQGAVDFMGCTLRCDRRALVPRPETEELVELILASGCFDQHPEAEVVDVGTGSGCIALALVAVLPALKVTGIDSSTRALSLARENASHLGLLERTCWLQGDLLAGWGAHSCDVVVANLPYIAEEEYASLPPSVRCYEPPEALLGGPDGLDVIRALIPQAHRVLRPGGWIFLEIGEIHSEAVTALLSGNGFCKVRAMRDLCRAWRFVQARAPAGGGGHV